MYIGRTSSIFWYVIMYIFVQILFFCAFHFFSLRDYVYSGENCPFSTQIIPFCDNICLFRLLLHKNLNDCDDYALALSLQSNYHMIFQRIKIWSRGRLVGCYSMSLNTIKQLKAKGFVEYVRANGTLELRR